MLPEPVREAILSIIESVDPEIFVVELALHRSKRSKLVLLMDTDQGITLDACTKISRMIGRYLEEEDIFDFAYDLEVSSPGLDRPLQLLRQYHKNIGRQLKVTLKDGNLQKGELVNVGDDGITLKPEQKKKKKKDAEELAAVEIQFDDIKEATVLVSFR